MPFTITNSYIGSLACDLSTIGLRSSSKSQADWVIYGIGLFIMIGVVVYITRLALRALGNYVSREELSESACNKNCALTGESHHADWIYGNDQYGNARSR
jgi:hypothetical protein